MTSRRDVVRIVKVQIIYSLTGQCKSLSLSTTHLMNTTLRNPDTPFHFYTCNCDWNIPFSHTNQCLIRNNIFPHRYKTHVVGKLLETFNYIVEKHGTEKILNNNLPIMNRGTKRLREMVEEPSLEDFVGKEVARIKNQTEVWKKPLPSGIVALIEAKHNDLVLKYGEVVACIFTKEAYARAVLNYNKVAAPQVELCIR